MDKQFLMFAVNNNLTLFVSLEINDGSEKKATETRGKVLGNDAFREKSFSHHPIFPQSMKLRLNKSLSEVAERGSE